MKLAHMILGSAAALLISGCGSTEEESNGGTLNNLPKWVSKAGAWYDNDSAGETAIYSVGMADPNVKSPSFQWTRARANARTEMASNIGTHVQAMYTEYQRQAGDAFQDGTESFIENVENVSRQIAEATLVGLQQVEAFKSEDTGQLFVLYKLPLDTIALEYKKQANAQMRERFASYSKEQKDAALDAMDKAIDVIGERAAKDSGKSPY